MSDDNWECVGPVNVWIVGFWGELIGTVLLYPGRFMWTWMLESQDMEQEGGLIGSAPTFEAAKRACEEAAINYMVAKVPPDSEEEL